MSKQVSKFTPSQVERMVSLYNSVVSKDDATRRAVIDVLAGEMGMPTRSIIGKLSTMKDVVYVPYSKAAPKKRAATNQEMVTALELTMSLEVGTLDSLVRGSKAAIQAVVTFVDGQRQGSEPEAQA